jgi:hypothetical protein
MEDAQCVRMDSGVQGITTNYMNYFLNQILLNPSKLEDYDRSRYSKCWMIVLLKTHPPKLDGCRKPMVGTENHLRTLSARSLG